jgi:hypothetical protein
MKKNLWGALGIVILAALFASQEPDGLEKISRVLGFKFRASAQGAPLADYHPAWLGASKLSTLIAGVIGVLILYGLFFFLGFLVRRFLLRGNRTSQSE